MIDMPKVDLGAHSRTEIGILVLCVISALGAAFYTGRTGNTAPLYPILATLTVVLFYIEYKEHDRYR